MTISHAGAEGECDLQLNKTRLANYEHKFSYAATAVRSGVYILRYSHVLSASGCEKRGRKLSLHVLSALWAAILRLVGR